MAMPVFSLVARRLAIHRISSPFTALRHASTKQSGPKLQIKRAITEPAPPLLARYPYVYIFYRVFKYGVGFALSLHIFAEYFFSLNLGQGMSMSPTLNASGDWMLLSKRYRRGRDVAVGDIISFKHPVDQYTYSVKRVVAMPGDIVLRDSPDTSGQLIQVCRTLKGSVQGT